MSTSRAAKAPDVTLLAAAQAAGGQSSAGPSPWPAALQAYEQWRRWPAQALDVLEQPEMGAALWQQLEREALRVGLWLLDTAQRVQVPMPEHGSDARDPAPIALHAQPAPPAVASAFAPTLPIPVVAQRAPVAPSTAPDEQATEPLLRAAGEPAPVTVTSAVAAKLQAKLSGTQLPPAAQPHRLAAAHDEALDAVRKRIGYMTHKLATVVELRSEVGTLRSAIKALQDNLWRPLQTGDRPLVLGWLAARVQYVVVRERSLHDDASAKQAQELRAALVALQGSEKLGIINGLGKNHKARHGTWPEDMRYFEKAVDARLGRAQPPVTKDNVDELVRRLRQERATLSVDAFRARVQALLDAGLPHADKRWLTLVEDRLGDLERQGAQAKVARAVSGLLADQEGSTPSDDCPQLQDWPGLAVTRGKRVLIAGGDGREERRRVLKTAFGFEELDWAELPKGNTRKLDSLAEAIRCERYDYCIVLQPFCSHALSGKIWDACSRTKAMPLLASSYGVRSLQAAFDRFLPRAQPLAAQAT